MFGRRAWYKTHPDIELPWLQTDEAASLRYEGKLFESNILVIVVIDFN